MKRICILLVLFLTILLTGSALGESESFLVISDLHFTEDAQENHSAAREAVIRAARGKDAVLIWETIPAIPVPANTPCSGNGYRNCHSVRKQQSGSSRATMTILLPLGRRIIPSCTGYTDGTKPSAAIPPPQAMPS